MSCLKSSDIIYVIFLNYLVIFNERLTHYVGVFLSVDYAKIIK